MNNTTTAIFTVSGTCSTKVFIKLFFIVYEIQVELKRLAMNKKVSWSYNLIIQYPKLMLKFCKINTMGEQFSWF